MASYEKASASKQRKLILVYLCPLVYQPHRINFAGRFKRLSERCAGYIFTLSGGRQRRLLCDAFQFFSEAEGGFVDRHIRRIFVQMILPVRLLWETRRAIDVIVAYDAYASGLAGVVLKLLLGTKLIVEINGDDQNQSSSGNGLIKRALMTMSFYASVKFSDAVKVVNTDQERYMRTTFPSKAIYRYPDYVASDYLASQESVQGDYLLSVGYPFQLKGMDILIQAFLLASRKYSWAKLKIMGFATEAELSHYRALANNDPRIEFTKPGWIEDVAELLRGCYAFVSASRREAAARVVFEAMACRKPILSSRTNSGIDYVRDGETGLLFNIGDVEDLVSKMDILLSDAQRAREMGDAGYSWLQEEFSEQRYVQMFLAMAEEVAKRKSDVAAGCSKSGTMISHTQSGSTD